MRAFLIIVSLFSPVVIKAQVITEIFEHTLGGGTNTGCAGAGYFSSDEYVEIYNNTGSPLDMSGWQISDGTSSDTIIAWDTGTDGTLTGKTVLNDNSTIIPAGEYAVILDPDYGGCDQRLNEFMPSNVYVLTITSTSFGTGGFSDTEVISLINPGASVISTYGAGSFTAQDAGDDFGWEMIDITGGDVDGNWQVSDEVGAGKTPGQANTVGNVDLVISEVMSVLPVVSNSCCDNGSSINMSLSMEYIEIYNSGSTTVNMKAIGLTDGQAVYEFQAWSTGNGVLRNPGVLTGTTLLEPGEYAVALDPDYALYGDQVYDFPTDTLIVTTFDADAAKSLFSGGLDDTETVTLYDAYGDTLSTFGTPDASTKATFASAVDDGLDSFPASLASFRGYERVDLSGIDELSNWQVSSDFGSFSPGGPNTTSGGFPKLDWVDFENGMSVSTANGPVVVATFDITTSVPIHQIGLGGFADFSSFDGTLQVQLYKDGFAPTNALSGSETLVGTFETCPKLEITQNIAAASESSVYFGIRDWLPFFRGDPIILDDNDSTSETFTPSLEDFNHFYGRINLASNVTNELTRAQSASISCNDGVWFLEGEEITSGRYKVVMNLSVAPTITYNFKLGFENYWIKDNSNRWILSGQLSQQVTVEN